MLHVSLLGEFGMTHNSIPIKDVNTPRLQSLFAYLILHTHAPQSRMHLASLFWPDTNESQARTNLRNLMHQLRRALPIIDTYVAADMHTIQWRPDAPFLLDIHDFKGAIAQAESALQQNSPRGAQTSLEEAVLLYQGDLLPDCFDDWIIPLRENLRQAFIHALEGLVSLLEDQRDYASAIHFARNLLQYDPLHEAAYRNLIRLHALNGDRAGALRIYHMCETLLDRELDVKPSQATREAYENLLGENVQAFSSPSISKNPPMVGRDREWAQLQRAWREVTACHGPQMVFIYGEAGVGKTRLVEEMIQWAARQGISQAVTRCYAAEGELAYAPVVSWLRALPTAPLADVWLAEVARLMPEILTERLDLPKPGPLTEEWQRQRLFEALSYAILGWKQPILLTIDDLQWCDRDTLEWLHFLLRFDQTARVCIIGAYRPEEIADSHPLNSTLQTLRTEGGITEIDLSPLGKDDTQSLAYFMAGREIDEKLAGFLFKQTEGNPLFLVEMVRACLSEAEQLPDGGRERQLSMDPIPDGVDLPLKVQSILEARLGQLSPSALALAGLAATIGRAFRFSLLVKASGREEDSLVNDLDELWQRRIIREQGLDAYDFSHDKLREVAYKQMSLGRRRLNHRQVAEALEAIHTSDLAPVSHQLAAHYDRAGHPGCAVPYYLQAAELARKVYANTEARTLLQRGLSLANKVKTRDEQWDLLIEQLWEDMGDLCKLSAEHEEALKAYQNAHNRVPHTATIDQARIYRKMAEIYCEQRHYAETLDTCQRAESLLGQLPSADINRWWDEWIDVQIEKIWAYYWLAQWQDMDALVERIDLVVKARANDISRMRFFKASCLMNLRKYRYVVSDRMVADSLKNLTTSRDYGSFQDQVDSHFELGFLHLWRHELDQAEEYLLLALELSRSCGNMLFETLSLTYLTVLYRFFDQEDKVLAYAQHTALAAEAAHMPDYAAATKANLAWLTWRKGDDAATEALGREALSIWQASPLVYPFQWQALWPLVGASLKHGQPEDTIKYVRALLAPTQQRLPDRLNDLLETAKTWLEADDIAEGIAWLNQAAQVAHELGYL